MLNGYHLSLSQYLIDSFTKVIYNSPAKMLQTYLNVIKLICSMFNRHAVKCRSVCSSKWSEKLAYSAVQYECSNVHISLTATKSLFHSIYKMFLKVTTYHLSLLQYLIHGITKFIQNSPSKMLPKIFKWHKADINIVQQTGSKVQISLTLMASSLMVASKLFEGTSKISQN